MSLVASSILPIEPSCASTPNPTRLPRSWSTMTPSRHSQSVTVLIATTSSFVVNDGQQVPYPAGRCGNVDRKWCVTGRTRSSGEAGTYMRLHRLVPHDTIAQPGEGVDMRQRWRAWSAAAAWLVLASPAAAAPTTAMVDLSASDGQPSAKPAN